MTRGDRELVKRFWGDTPLRALVPLLLGIFFTFTAVGFLVDVAGGCRMEPRALLAIVALSGLVAVAYGLIVMRRRFWLFAPVVVLQVLSSRWLERVWPPAETALLGDALRLRLTLDAGGAVAGLALGYGFFMMFIVRQGLRRVRTEAEMALAREIHVSLVPDVALETPHCEMYGRSIPASEVGGDFVDALVVADRPLGFVADVSGHGVPAGSLLGLLKAGLRTRLRGPGDPGAVLADLNEVLCDLTRPNTFATAAILSLETEARLAYALAGHPPILHLRCADGSVARLSEGGMALGILAGERYSVGHADVRPGDLLAILTDGFTETMDRRDRELGMAPIEDALRAHAGETLPALFDRLLDVARAHGPQQDDRTLLLVRIRRA
jgi:sigma-B regulation protein RsbU (phosphoserine phosphatase)